MASGAGAGALALLLLLGVVVPAGASAQAFPGEAPPPPGFPTALSGWALAGWSGRRATRTYSADPTINDPACDATKCERLYLVGAALGIGLRFQTSLTPRTGVRFGVSISRPGRKVGLRNGLSLAIDTTLSAIRGEALLLFRLRRQAPVFFGLGAALARFSPGPVVNQGDLTEFGGAIAIGYDHRVNRNVGTRLEWTAYLMHPVTTRLSSEFQAARFAFDHQFSFGVNYYVGP